MIAIRDALDGYERYERRRRPPASYVEAVAAVLPELQIVWRKLGLHKPRVVPCNLDGAGCYINGSCTDPIILLDVEGHIKISTTRGILDRYHLRELVKSSIVHELIHAHLDTNGLDCESHDEDAVEEAATRYCFDDDLDALLETLNLELRKAA